MMFFVARVETRIHFLSRLLNIYTCEAYHNYCGTEKVSRNYYITKLMFVKGVYYLCGCKI